MVRKNEKSVPKRFLQRSAAVNLTAIDHGTCESVHRTQTKRSGANPMETCKSAIHEQTVMYEGGSAAQSTPHCTAHRTVNSS